MGDVGLSTSFRVIEAFTQVAAGTCLIFLSNIIFMPILGIDATMTANATLVAINTIVAFFKSYGVRVIFGRLSNE